MNRKQQNKEEIKYLKAYSAQLADRIGVLRSNVWGYVILTTVVLLLGVIVTIYGYIDSSLSTKLPGFIKLGPLFISSAIISFPMKDILTYRVKIQTCKSLKSYFDSCGVSSPDQTSIELYKIIIGG
jgi:hypothetical protein